MSSTNGHGGARLGAGGKPAGYVKPPEAVEFDKARTRKELALADKYELEFKIQSEQYIDRGAVRQASATIYAGVVQALRSISDNLERQGIPIDVCERVDAIITETLAEAGKKMSQAFGAAPQPAPADNSDLF